jgi:hypothetical protein
MDAILRKETRSALAEIIGLVAANNLFDSHTIIETFAKDPKKLGTYRKFCAAYGVTFADRTKLKQAHSQLSKMIGDIPGVARHLDQSGKQWEAFSHNINNGLNANKVWEFESREAFEAFLKKVQSEQ